MTRKKTIAVDFDGVIHKYSSGFRNGLIYDEPVEGVREALRKLVLKGYEIVIFTVRLNPMFDDENHNAERDMRANIVEWLEEHRMLKGVHWHELTNNKPPAIAYIDDRGIRFTNWSDITKYFA